MAANNIRLPLGSTIYRRDRHQVVPKIRPPYDFKPPYASMCYREGPMLDVVAVPPVSEIEMYLKCSKCTKLSPPESRQCSLGHIICPPCLEAVSSCPKIVTYQNGSGTVLCHRGFVSCSAHWAHRRFVEEITSRSQPIEEDTDKDKKVESSGSYLSSFKCVIL